MENVASTADQLRTNRMEGFPEPDDWQGWVDVWCPVDTGNIDCVAECLRPHLVGKVTPEGWLKLPEPPFSTPLKYARWSHMGRWPKPPWSGTGWNPDDIRHRWELAQAELAAKAELEDPTAWNSDLYFIGGATGPIKIGISGNVKKRLKTLQTAYPHKLEILCVVERAGHLEIDYHDRFAAHRLEGEWFAPHPDILAEIERLKA